MNLLITGGAGFIGSHTSLLLLEQGFNLVIYDSFHNSSERVFKRFGKILKWDETYLIKRIKVIKGDIRDKKLLYEVFNNCLSSGEPISAVLHFAGLKSVSESVKKPTEYWDVNFFGTKNLIEVMAKYDCNKLVFSSSATVYGNKGLDIIKENCEINPKNTYGQTKAKVEEILLEKYQITREWKVINLRYFNPIGAHNSCLLGEYSKNNFENLFPILCKVANKEIEFLEIFGNDWETKDGTCIRDFIHVIDIAEGHISALNYMLKNKRHALSINLGTGKGTTILELINTFQTSTSNQINYIFSERKDGDVASYVASKEKAEFLLNWRPKLNLSEMCIDGWNWYLRKNTFQKL
jgi:UDP-glucose 4-epimerase